MHARVRWSFGWLPPILTQDRFILQPKDLDLQWSTALDHLLLAIATKSPHG